MVNLKFWKKDKEDNFEDFGKFDRDGGAFGPAGQNVPTNPQQLQGSDLGLPGVPQQPLTPAFTSLGSQIEMIGKNIELLSSKLDSLKSYLDNLNQKLANIENKLNSSGSSSDNSNRGWPY